MLQTNDKHVSGMQSEEQHLAVTNDNSREDNGDDNKTSVDEDQLTDGTVQM